LVVNGLHGQVRALFAENLFVGMEEIEVLCGGN